MKIVKQTKGIKLVEQECNPPKNKSYHIDIYDVDDPEGRINKITIFCSDFSTAERLYESLKEITERNRMTGILVTV